MAFSSMLQAAFGTDFRQHLLHRLITQRLWLLAAAFALFPYSPAYSAEEPSRPNIVFILTDDQGYADLGCYGAKDVKTPNVDRMAQEGTRFTSFYVAQPVCTASRSALLTGCYSNRVSMAGALNHTSTVGLHRSETLLSELCKQQGYATAIYGKWHLGHQPQFLPTKRGFDEWAGIPYSNDNGPLHPVLKDIPALPWYENDKAVEANPDQTQFTKRITERAVKFIEKNKDKPFFLYVPHIMPHVPIHASERFKGTSQRGLYGDVIQELDWSVGEILAALSKNGLDEKTIVVYTSDNGPFLSYGDHAGRSLPLREGKLTAFEGGVREPCVMRWTGHIPKGRVCDDLVTTMDLFASFVHLTGAKAPAHKIDGLNVTPLLLGEKGAKGRDIFWYYNGDELHAVRKGDWKLHVPHEFLVVDGEPGKGGKPANFANIKPTSIELSGIRGIASRHGYRVEMTDLALFDLKADPSEKINVAGQHPDVVKRLLAVVDEARADLGDSLTKTRGPGVRPATDARTPTPDGVKRLANLEYSNPEGKRQILLDLYLPTKESTKPLPVVLWIHGGGWNAGNKEKCPLIWLAAEGYAVASMDYRLTWESQWPAQMDDCRAAVRWLRTNAKKYNLDADHIGVGGGSAGGHLVALLGTQEPPKDEKISSRVQAVGDWFGPSDLLTMPPNMPGPGKTNADLAKSNGAKLLGGTVHERPELAKQASALYQVSKTSAPFLILHGDKDDKVPLDQSERLNAKLKEAGVESALIVVKGAGHGGKGFETAELHAAVRTFFDKHLKGE